MIGTATGWAFLALAPTAGCHHAQPTQPPEVSANPAPTQTDVMGDWNDVYAAVQIAAKNNEAAVLSKAQSDREQSFELKLICDDHATITARRDTPAPPYGARDPNPITIHLSCTVGLFGDPTKERALLDATERRIEQLKGVDWAPVP